MSPEKFQKIVDKIEENSKNEDKSDFIIEFEFISDLLEKRFKYLENKNFSEEEFNKLISRIKLKPEIYKNIYDVIFAYVSDEGILLDNDSYQGNDSYLFGKYVFETVGSPMGSERYITEFEGTRFKIIMNGNVIYCNNFVIKNGKTYIDNELITENINNLEIIPYIT